MKEPPLNYFKIIHFIKVQTLINGLGEFFHYKLLSKSFFRKKFNYI